MLYSHIKKGFPIYCLLLILSINSCNGIFEQEKSTTIIFQLENSSTNNITIIRHKESNSKDTVYLASNELFSETETGGGPGDSGKDYSERFDTIQIIYNDSITITHLRNNEYPILNRPIFYSDTWDFIKKEKIKNWLTEVTRRYYFTNLDFEEAKIKGEKIP